MPEKTRGWHTVLSPLASLLEKSAEKLLADGLLEALAGGEGRDRLRGDIDLLAVHRTAPSPRLPGPRKQGAEADHGDALALRHVRDDGFEHRIHRFACCDLADVPRFCRNLDQIGLGHHVWHAFSPAFIPYCEPES